MPHSFSRLRYDLPNLQTRLQAVRRKMRISQEEIARQYGTHRGTISRYEGAVGAGGKITTPPLDYVVWLAERANEDLHWIVFGHRWQGGQRDE